MLKVNIFRVGTEAQRSRNVMAIDEAVTVWQQIYAAAGISLDVKLFDVRSDSGNIPDPTTGSDFYLTNTSAATVAPQAINLFIGEDVNVDSGGGDSSGTLVLGISSNIPGPALPTTKSAVALSLTNHAGTDGFLSSEEIQLFGETMAHESGHYLGLFHPVESGEDENTFEDDDPLADTAVCTTTAECISNGLAQNVLFPIGLPGIRQQSLTSNQGRVLNLQVLVD